jgi:hypothetical protein
VSGAAHRAWTSNGTVRDSDTGRPAVNRHGPRAGSAVAELASTPTPGPRTAMRRSDRAVEVMARRTPWILRGMARLTPATGRS